ncbi:hypothetical protein [Kribbella sp. VKM Ac-2566]|uniref:hypothetical protein n=1 Tax=Kribbella sp. VKM Ac-2566 TaxID=2512218 RepID=UPI0010631991|nr:hypothetical protein [Kribbella sp. VKM Ac-2566]TDX08246.1 hypothetical protein EV647_0509 [Kribbella sp. VKM Ac-2566]
MTDDDDDLRLDELIPAPSGSWWGLLFDNPTIGLAPQLTWGFTFPFEEVTREDGSSPVSLDIEWLPSPANSWQRMAGQRLTCAGFAEPAEASIYFYLHHRFDAIELNLVEQRGTLLHAAAEVSGDIDGLGMEVVRAERWLTFAGLLVSLSDATSPDTALTRLNEFTDATGLAFNPDSGNAALTFMPATS